MCVYIYGSYIYYIYIFTFSKETNSKLTHYSISVQEVGQLLPWNPHYIPWAHLFVSLVPL